MKIPKTQLISKEEYETTMKRLMDIQIMAEAATKAVNEFKATIASTF